MIYHNERDLEIPALLEFLRLRPDIESALDVGACGTQASYAPEVRTLLKQYDGVDILPDPATAEILDGYDVGSLRELAPRTYDCVFSISTIEHSGISTYKAGDYHLERGRVFIAMYELARKYLLVTCPFGTEMLIPDQYANVTEADLVNWEAVTGPLQVDFYFVEGLGGPFHRIDRETARLVEFDPALGYPRCVAIIKATK